MKIKYLNIILFLIIPALNYASVLTISGKVIDNISKEPIPYANIGIPHLSIGTSANENGEFILKIPLGLEKDTLICSSVGYVSFKQQINSINTSEALIISLKQNNVLLKEVVIKPLNTKEIIEKVIKNKTVNYNTEPVSIQGFYREIVKEHSTKNYFVHSEGILDIYKSSVKKVDDRVRLLKGRTKKFAQSFEKDGKKIVLPAIVNGPHAGIILDIVKDKSSFINQNHQFTFEDEGYTLINDKSTHVLKFRPKRNNYTIMSVDFDFYAGKVYIDPETFAVVRAEYNIIEKGLRAANVEFDSVNNPILLTSRRIVLEYMLYKQKRYLQSIIVQNEFTYYGDLIRLDNQIEFHTTEIKTEGVEKFSRKEAFTLLDALNQKITQSDDSFWGDFNFIKDVD
jgi:CarboxypepD_reg-like domain